MATDYTQTVRRSAPIEAAQENYLDLLTQQVGRAPGSAGVPTLAELGPQIAGQNVLTQAAQQQAATQAGLGQLTFGAEGQVTGTGQGTGVAGYQPFLDQAAQYSGPQGYQGFMSPYQQDIIDTSLAEFDKQRSIQQNQISQKALTAGAFGGARQGVQEAEFGAQTLQDRALLQAQMLGQGFAQSNQLANQAFGQQQSLASQVPGLYQQDIGTLGSAGAGQQAQEQAQLDAIREANRLEAYEPYERLGYLGSGIASIASGAPGQYQSMVTPNPTPLQNALGIASVAGGLMSGYGDMMGTSG